MRTIDTPGSFRRDFKRESKGPHKTTLGRDLKPIIDALVLDQPLAASYRDDSLTGEWTTVPRMSYQARPAVDLQESGRRQADPGPPRLA
jgi:mRNA-degrading endonuclease YafQ of YafQ-DinJ toxin-antitoxin module